MKDPEREGRRWLKQAEHDLSLAEHDLAGGYASAACFNAHQAGEKALKALLYARGERVVLGHSVAELCQRAAVASPQLGDLRPLGHRLDRYYLTTRYPNAIPGEVPFEAFDQEEGREALAMARQVLDRVKGLLG